MIRANNLRDIFCTHDKMAYSDPQRGRDAVRAWRKANPELVRQQRKTATIRRALKEQRLPSLCTISRHGLNDEDLRCIVDAVMCGQGMPLVASIGRAVVERGRVEAGVCEV